ncbi:MAG: CocE/NonD family hydrolase [Victivallales bacterium]|nr:CocE/NonD family hydrolase [Victivallales bacterium]
MEHDTIYERRVAMRDNVELYTVVVLPGEGKGRYPTIVCRTPYASLTGNLEHFRTQHECFGYAYVYQHCRGTGMSQGVCVPYVNERNDGLDLLEWIRQQPFYNGEIFLEGSSYLSSVHYSYINTDPKDVKGAFLPVQDCKRYNIVYRHGFLNTGLHTSCAVRMYKKNMEIQRDICEETWRTLPLAGVTKAIFNELDEQLEEEMLHPSPEDKYWQTPAGGSDYLDVCNRCSFPILLATSWYDLYTEGVFDMWEQLTPERRKNCAMVVTPFDHNYNPFPRTEASDVPDFENGRLREVCPNLMFKWFDQCRGVAALDFVKKGNITYYRAFDRKWITSQFLENAPRIRELFLTSDRRLLPTPPAECGSITYTYNPFAPASFAGGVCNNFGGLQVQSAPNSRYDIISFMSEPIEQEIVCEGRIQVKLCCRSTAPDTCFYVRLSFVRDGIALSLRDDIDSLCRLSDYTPGEEKRLEFTFAPHAFKLLPGDQLRLDVSSSCVPFFQVHTNRKGLQALQIGADVCRNTIVIGASKIIFYTK